MLVIVTDIHTATAEKMEAVLCEDVLLSNEGERRLALDCLKQFDEALASYERQLVGLTLVAKEGLVDPDEAASAGCKLRGLIEEVRGCIDATEEVLARAERHIMEEEVEQHLRKCRMWYFGR